MPSLMPNGKQQYFFPGTPLPLVGGKLYTYAAGTSALKPTYQDAAGTTPNANPITLDSSGSALIFWDGSYKMVLKDALGNTVYTVDNYNTDPNGLLNLLTSVGSSLVGFIQAAGSAIKRSVQDKLREHVSVLDFGAKGDGGDDTAALQKALDAGVPLDFLGLSYHHTGLTLTTTGNVYWRGKGAQLVYAGSGIGVLVQTINNANAVNCSINGITYVGGTAALKVQGQGNGVFSNININDCGVKDTTSGALWVYHGDGVRVTRCRAENGGDNGVYVEFSKNIDLSHNTVKNCKGSGAITVAYSDGVVDCTVVNIASNLIYCDDNAQAGNYIAGVQVGYAKGVTITGNTIANYQTNPSVTTSIKTGINVDEWPSSDVLVTGNNIVAPWEYGIRSGTTDNSIIRRLRIAENKIYNAGLAGMYMNRVPEGLEIVNNLVDRANQQGIYVDATVDNYLIAWNSLRDVGIQPNYCNYAAIEAMGRGYRINNNEFFCGAEFFSINAAGRPTPEFSVDSNAKVLTLRENGAVIGTFNFAGRTIEDVRYWIATSVPGWTAAYSAGSLSDMPAENLRRSGPRNGGDVGFYSANSWIAVSSAEPKYLVYAPANEGKVFGNRWTSAALEYPDSFDGTQKVFSLGGDVQTDTNAGGASTYMATSPGALPFRFYVVGDRCINSAPAVGQPKAWVCTSPGKAPVWTSEGNL
jgi:parallel beta-helix repeat protein